MVIIFYTLDMPYAFCVSEENPWHEYAENAEHGPTTRILSAVGTCFAYTHTFQFSFIFEY